MHSQGYMHRDIKTDNVMIREEGSLNCVLIDFGLATKSTADKLIFPRCGTPGYVAP
jgi:serine/threonine protein kinase